jgi:hypothetical protein
VLEELNTGQDRIQFLDHPVLDELKSQ